MCRIAVSMEALQTQAKSDSVSMHFLSEHSLIVKAATRCQRELLVCAMSVQCGERSHSEIVPP